MADLMEYYQQIGELKKAVRERELHRLELEKQALFSNQTREKRHEDFKDKIRDIQRELAHKEREAAHNFQSLLSRVDSIRREHQLLAAHTDQLRQRKLQYEMSLRSANPILHTAVHQDLSGLLSNQDEAAWKGHIQATSTPSSKSQLHQHSLPSQPFMSPIPPYNQQPSTANMSTQPIDRHIPRGVNLKANQQQPFTVSMTSPSMPSNNLTEESLPHNAIFSHTQQGNMVRIPSTYNQPSHVDYAIPHDISREPPPHDGMVSHPHSNMAKTSTIYSQPPHVDYRIPHISREPLDHDGTVSQIQGNLANTQITHSQPSHGDYIVPHVSRESLTDSGMASQTQGNTDKTHTLYIHPSHLGHMIHNDVSRGGLHQNLSALHPTTRDSLEYNRSINVDASLIPTSNQLAANNPTPSIPVPLQSVIYPSGAEMNYLTHLPQSTPQPQHLPGTSSLQTSGYLPAIHTNLPTHLTNDASNYSPDKLTSLNGFQSEYMSPHLKSFPRDSLHHESSPPSLNNTSHPESDTQYNRVTLPPSTDIYKPQPNLLVNREEIPVKDTYAPQASVSGQDYVEMDKAPNSLREEGLIKTTPTMSNVDGKYYDGRTQYDSPVSDETKNDKYMNSPTLKPYDVLTHDNNTSGDDERNIQKTVTPERCIPTTSTRTDLMEAKHDLVPQTEPSLVSASQPTVNLHHQNYHKPSGVQITDDTNAPELKSVVTIDTDLNKDIYNSKVDNGGEIKQEIKLPDRQFSSSKEAPSSTLTKHNSLDRQSSSSKESPSPAYKKNSPIRTTSDLPSKASQNELMHPDRHSTSSKESPISPHTKHNTRPTSAMPSKTPLQNMDDSDTDFFNQNTNVTNSAVYKSLVGNTRKGSNATDSENDETEGQVLGMISKPQTPPSRPAFKSFASSIPSLRPAPPDTDTDSVDSVEAAIQAAMKKRDHEDVAESSKETPHHKSSLRQETKSDRGAEQVKSSPVKPGTDKLPDKKKQNTAAALAINLDSECESYEVSAGGEASDEDDFDFYDKF